MFWHAFSKPFEPNVWSRYRPGRELQEDFSFLYRYASWKSKANFLKRFVMDSPFCRSKNLRRRWTLSGRETSGADDCSLYDGAINRAPGKSLCRSEECGPLHAVAIDGNCWSSADLFFIFWLVFLTCWGPDGKWGKLTRRHRLINWVQGAFGSRVHQ